VDFLSWKSDRSRRNSSNLGAFNKPLDASLTSANISENRTFGTLDKTNKFYNEYDKSAESFTEFMKKASLFIEVNEDLLNKANVKTKKEVSCSLFWGSDHVASVFSTLLVLLGVILLLGIWNLIILRKLEQSGKLVSLVNFILFSKF